MLTDIEPHTVFVYGSLKRGGMRHDVLKDCKFLGTAKLPGFKLYEVVGADFPCIVEMPGYEVEGEVYEIPESMLEVLDNIEAEGVLYYRERHLTTMGTCWVYVWAGKGPVKPYSSTCWAV